MSQLELTLIESHELDWHDEGICAQTDPDAFYPETGQDGTAAKKVCRECPVRDLCLQWAFEIGDTWAVMGGLTYAERLMFRKQKLKPTRDNIDRWIDASFEEKRQRRLRVAEKVG